MTATSFMLDQRVWKYEINYHKQTIVCEACHGKGRFTALENPDMLLQCPECAGKGGRTVPGLNVYNIRELTVGLIRVTTTHEGVAVEYMCSETGVGSGSVYRQDGPHRLYASAVACDAAAREAGGISREEHLQLARLTEGEVEFLKGLDDV